MLFTIENYLSYLIKNNTFLSMNMHGPIKPSPIMCKTKIHYCGWLNCSFKPPMGSLCRWIC